MSNRAKLISKVKSSRRQYSRQQYQPSYRLNVNSIIHLHRETFNKINLLTLDYSFTDDFYNCMRRNIDGDSSVKMYKINDIDRRLINGILTPIGYVRNCVFKWVGHKKSYIKNLMITFLHDEQFNTNAIRALIKLINKPNTGVISYSVLLLLSLLINNDKIAITRVNMPKTTLYCIFMADDFKITRMLMQRRKRELRLLHTYCDQL